MKKLIFGIMIALCAASCSRSVSHIYTAKGESPAKSTAVASGSNLTEGQRSNLVKLQPTGGPVVNLVPPATAFRMSGDYYDNVAITLGPDGEISYFPAPTDITADSKPVALGDGWWLNNQGFGPNTVFTKYTFAQYAELDQTPDPEQLKLAIIPGAKVTKFVELPMNINEAAENLDAVKAYVKTL